MNKTFAEIQKESAEEYQSLFDFFANNHDLILTVGEMEDVIYAVKEHSEQRQETASAVDTIVSDKSRGGTISISWGKYGGFYAMTAKDGFTKRLCLGWVAFTYWPVDLDNLIDRLLH